MLWRRFRNDLHGRSKRSQASGYSSASFVRSDFAMAKIVERVIGNAVYELRIPFSREIGRVIVHFAYFEQCVQEMVWDAMGVSEAVGRIAIREPRITDRLEMLRDLIGLRGGAL